MYKNEGRVVPAYRILKEAEGMRDPPLSLIRVSLATLLFDHKLEGVGGLL